MYAPRKGKWAGKVWGDDGGWCRKVRCRYVERKVAGVRR